jgi:hypothetical protein
MNETPAGGSSKVACSVPAPVTVIVVVGLLELDTDTPPVVTQFLKLYPELGAAVIDVMLEASYQPLALSTVPPVPAVMVMEYWVL